MVDIKTLKENYIALVSEKPVSQWSNEDVILVNELLADKEIDFVECISDADLPPKLNK